MILTSILDGVANVLDFLFGLMPGYNLQTVTLGQSLRLVIDYVEQANAIFPIDTLLTVIGLFAAFALAMTALYWAMRLINLIRGAG